MIPNNYEILGAKGLTPFSVDFKRNELEKESVSALSDCILCKQKLIISSDSWP